MILHDFDIYCSNLVNGCGWSGLANNLKEHLKDCPFKNKLNVGNIVIDNEVSDFVNDANKEIK